MSELLKYLQTHRQVGHTKALLDGAKVYDKPFYVLSGNYKSALDISKQSGNKNAIPISITEFSLQKTLGTEYPVLIDGFAVTSEIEKINRIHDRISELREAENDSQTQSIKDTFKNYENFLLSKIDSLHGFLNKAKEDLRESKDRVNKLDARVNKTKNRLAPTMKELSNLSMWDRIFNYNKKVKNIIDDYLY